MNAFIKSQYSAESVTGSVLDALASSQTQLRTTRQPDWYALATSRATTSTSQNLGGRCAHSRRGYAVVTMHIPFRRRQPSTTICRPSPTSTNPVLGPSTRCSPTASCPDLGRSSFLPTMNVFGRNLSGISKVTSRTGRDPLGAITTSWSWSGRISNPASSGGVVADSSGGYAANGINPSTGLASASGGIMAGDTLVAAARTLGAGLGIPRQRPSGRLGQWRAQRHGRDGHLGPRHHPGCRQLAPLRSRLRPIRSARLFRRERLRAGCLRRSRIRNQPRP